METCEAAVLIAIDSGKEVKAGTLSRTDEGREVLDNGCGYGMWKILR